MIRRPPRSTRTDTLFPTRRSSDLGRWSKGCRAHKPTRRGCAAPKDPPATRVRRHSRHSNRAIFERAPGPAWRRVRRSEEHTSELQSLMRISYAVFCLKKKNKRPKHNKYQIQHITKTHETIA